MTKILNKPSVDIHKPQEAFNFFYLGGSFLFLDYFDFIVLHLDLSSLNYYF